MFTTISSVCVSVCACVRCVRCWETQCPVTGRGRLFVRVKRRQKERRDEAKEAGGAGRHGACQDINYISMQHEH